MAGSDSRFNSELFIEAILFAQEMGLPPVEADQPLFFEIDDRTYEFSDADEQPWDFTDPGDVEPPGEPAPVGVRAICGLMTRETKAMPDQVAAGEFTPTRIKLSFVPAEWAKVSNFHTVRIGGVDYTRGKSYPPSGLFGVEITNVEVRAPEAEGRA